MAGLCDAGTTLPCLHSWTRCHLSKFPKKQKNQNLSFQTVLVEPSLKQRHIIPELGKANM